MGGRATERSLPATGSALFHLGALLIPVNVAAANVELAWGWQGILLAQGIVGTLSFSLLAKLSRSVVLRWAAAASVVAVSGGLAALTQIPAPAVLAVAAAIWVYTKKSDHIPIAWVVIAGYAPVIGLASFRSTLGTGTLQELGIFQASPIATIPISALIVAVLGTIAHRRSDAVLGFVSIGALVVGIVEAMVGAQLEVADQVLVVPALFVLLELGVLFAGRDEFWKVTAKPIGIAIEVAAVYGWLLLVSQADGPTGAIAFALAAIGWVLADLRRAPANTTPSQALHVGGGLFLTAPLVVASVGLAINHGFHINLMTGIVLLVLGTAAGLTKRPLGGLTTCVAVAAAAPTSWAFGEFLFVGSAMGIAGSFAIAAVVVARVRHSETAKAGQGHSLMVLSALGILGLSLWAGTWPVANFHEGAPTMADWALPVALAAVIGAFACWGLAAILDRADRALGTIARSGLAVSAITALLLDGSAALLPAVAVILIAVAESVRLKNSQISWAAIPSAIHVQVILAISVLGLRMEYAGLALCVAGTVWMLASALAERPWRDAIMGAGVSTMLVGTLMASIEPGTLGMAFFLDGAVILGIGLALRIEPLAHLGGIIAIVGGWVVMSDASVHAPEAYVAPVALQLAVLGTRTRMNDEATSSWIAYGPSIAMLGGIAFAQRVSGESANHALIAGAVAVLAVACGGIFRLSGPLFLGTALLVAITGHESLAAAATIPTWAWLALGGVTLLGVATALERSDTTPAETGRRLVERISEQFE